MPQPSTSSAERFAQLRRSDLHGHLCLVYHDTAEQLALTASYLRVGLEAGERCLYVADDNSLDAVAAALSEAGIDVGMRLRSGALRVTSKYDTYLSGGRFELEAMANFLIDSARAATADGFRALRVASEATWGIGPHPGLERAFEVEHRLNELIAGVPMHGVCQYHSGRFPPEVIGAALEAHSHLLLPNQVTPNPYFGGATGLPDVSRSAQPLIEALDELAGQLRHPPERRSGSRSSTASPSGLRVLVIDDEEMVTAVVERLLRRMAGHAVVIAHTAEAARDILESDDRFDAVLCDLHLPGLDGLGLHEWAQTHAPGLAELFIFVTGGATTAVSERQLSRLNNPILAKPFNPRQLTEAIERMRAQHAAH